MSSARTRSLTNANATPQTYGERGRWLEVIDGGAYGFKNKITLQGVDRDAALSGEQDVPCVSGTLIVADFEEIVLATVAADTVLVRLGHGLPPPPLTGKQRVRWLARGSGQVIASGAAATFVDLTGSPLDMFDTTRERHELLTWCGWIFCTKTFEVYASVRANPETPTGELVVQRFVTRAALVLPVGVTGTVGNVCMFDDGAGTAGSNPSAPFLPNTQRVQVANTDATNGTFAYCIGVRG